jgi:hypothetical protein
MKDIEVPGSFATQLNWLCQKNKLPPVNLDGFVPPSIPIPIVKILVESALVSSETVIGEVPENVHSVADGGDGVDSGDGVNDVGDHEVVASCESDSHLPDPVEATLNEERTGNVPLSVANSCPSRWDEFKVYKPKSISIKSTDGMIKAWEQGNLLITRLDGNVADYGSVIDVASQSKVLPTIVGLTKAEFTNLQGSPGRSNRANMQEVVSSRVTRLRCAN